MKSQKDLSSSPLLAMQHSDVVVNAFSSQLDGSGSSPD